MHFGSLRMYYAETDDQKQSITYLSVRGSVIILAIACCLTSNRVAFGVISYTGTPIVEDFSSLPTATTASVFPNAPLGQPISIPGMLFGTEWVGARIGGNGGTSGTQDMSFTRYQFSGTTNSTVGAVLTAGTTPTDSDRSLGILTSAAHQSAIGVEIVNFSSAPLTSVSISFWQENWRTPGSGAGLTYGVQNITPAEFGTTASGVSSGTIFTALTGFGFTPVPALDLVSAVPQITLEDPLTTDAPIVTDGNLPENRVKRSATIDFSSSPIQIGDSFFLRFMDVNVDGADAAFAIDDFRFAEFPEMETLPGDFNLDDKVDAADYVFWRDTMSVSNPDGYAEWSANFGATNGEGTSVGSVGVPEPGVMSLMATMLSMLILGRIGRRITN